jgi:hypothetical protein
LSATCGCSGAQKCPAVAQPSHVPQYTLDAPDPLDRGELAISVDTNKKACAAALKGAFQSDTEIGKGLGLP